MKVLIAGEESQAICIAFRKRGHEAYSCDLQPCSGGHPEWHIQGDWIKPITSCIWDLIIFHPVCDYMALSGNRWYGWGTSGYYLRCEAIDYTIKIWAKIKKHAKRATMENPLSVLWSHISEPVQYVQPHYFGDPYFKKTGLALYNLPELIPTNRLNVPQKGTEENKRWSFCHRCPPGPNRKRDRSKTHPGIAEAMAEQWGKI